MINAGHVTALEVVIVITMNEWTIERMNEWMTDRANEWMNEWKNEWKFIKEWNATIFVLYLTCCWCYWYT